VDKEDLGHLKGQRLPENHLCARDTAEPRFQAPPDGLRTERGAHPGVYSTDQVTDGHRHRADDQLPDDGVEGLHHLVAGIADLASDGVAQHRSDHGSQHIFVGDPALQVVQFCFQLGNLLAVAAEQDVTQGFQ
jgi:hypothetical protein